LDRPHFSRMQEVKAGQEAVPGDRGHLVLVERRHSPRFPAVQDRVWMGWWSNAEEFVTTAAEVDNISRGGAKIMMAIPPEESEQLWIRLAQSGSVDCVQATVLEVQPSGEGSYWVRLAFASSCPLSFHEAVVRGMKQRPVCAVDSSA
jgi:hypothetical protein